MLLLPIFIGMLLPAAATYFARLTGPVQGKLLMLLRSGARAHTPAEAGVTRLVPVQTGDLGNRQSIVLPTVCTGLGLGKQTNKNTTRESNPTDVKITKGHDYPKGKTALLPALRHHCLPLLGKESFLLSTVLCTLSAASLV